MGTFYVSGRRVGSWQDFDVTRGSLVTSKWLETEGERLISTKCGYYSQNMYHFWGWAATAPIPTLVIALPSSSHPSCHVVLSSLFTLWMWVTQGEWCGGRVVWCGQAEDGSGGVEQRRVVMPS